MGGFANPIIGGVSKLIRAAIESPNYVPNISGWAIMKNGKAEFQDVIVRGTLQVVQSVDKLLIYNGAPALGNLVLSISGLVATVDSFGNAIPAGYSGKVPFTTGVYDMKFGAGLSGGYYYQENNFGAQSIPTGVVTQLTGISVSNSYNDYGGSPFFGSKWTCPKTGIYSINAILAYSGWSGASRSVLYIRVNAASLTLCDIGVSAAGYVQASLRRQFTVNDIVTFFAFHDQAAARTLDSTTGKSSVSIQREL